ncbi:type II toxin-antitoxin system RelE/ParE family toxin [Sphingomonas sp. DT-204]|uniref:type II toxin-antitoxin system RelE/ParE family toxin n=1 Tax=Sphingomonas sp. DT-204 TaxID=3396166 RepID=UPI003F1D9BE9
MRLERSRTADRDLDEILAYSLLRFGEATARDYFFSFADAFGLLERHPHAGEAVDDIQPGVRRLKHRQHRIFYEIERDRIFVLRILHHAMALDDRFDDLG